MSHVKKILPALGLVVAFGAVAVILAQDLPASGMEESLQRCGVVKTGPAHMDRYTLSVGMDSESTELVNPLSPEPEVHRVVYFRNIQTFRLSIFSFPHAAGVPLQLLNSVFLI